MDKLYILWEKFKKATAIVTKPHKRRKLDRYSFPILLLVIAYLVKSLLNSHLNIITPYLTSTFIVILSAWYGGLGPGILATIIAGFLNNYLFLEPRFTLNGTGNTVSMIIFLIQGIFISMISEAKHQADTQKDEFISFASHELKNPLAVLKGYSSLINKKVSDKKIQNYAAKLDTNIDKITNLINELLDLTRIESGKLSLRKERVNIQSLVKNIIKDQQLVTSSHKIKLTGKSSKKILADKTRIGQVITNMITNAIKYSPGKKNVEVSIADKKNSIIITVKDYGIGLTEAEQDKIFNRFYRVKNTRTQGLGLGLFISQQIVHMHNGRLWVKSIKGKGSTFKCLLPAK
jgi:signal transduction histidine kinase